jgi:hypothetical protein
MALTITAQPPARCYVGTPTKDGNVVPFDFTSNLSPLNTTATPRTILAKGTTDSGFFYIEVNASFAAEFPTGGYVQGNQAGLRDVLYIVQGITGTNHRIVLAVQDSGWIVGSSTAVPAFNNFAVEIQLLSPGRDDRYILTSEKNDLQGYYRRILKERLLAAEGVDVELLAREIYTGSSTSFTSVQESTAFWGRLDADQTDTGRLLSGRPRASRVYDGQRVPFAFIGDDSANIVADFGDYDTFTPIVDGEMNLYIHEVFHAGSPENVITLGGIGAYTLQIVKPRLEYVELVFRNKDGQWDSTFVFFNGQRQSEDKDEQYISTYREAASSYGAQITNKGRQFFQNNTSRVWQMTTGVVGDNEVQWLVDLLASDSVFYRNENDYWPVRILPTATNWDDLTTSHPSISFEMVSAFGLTLQKPEPVSPVDPVQTIWDAFNARATADGALLPALNGCFFNRFKSLYKRPIPSLIFNPSRVKASKAYSVIPSSGLGDLDFTRVGDTATRVNEAGVIENVPANVPRIDYTGGGCGKLLLEPQRTNILSNREVMADEAISVSNIPYTLSFYGTGNVFLTEAGIELSGTGVNERVTLTFTPPAGTLNIVVTGSCTKGQIEAGSYATSYIYSLTGATVTRGADVCSKTGISSLIGQTSGSAMIDVNLNLLSSGGVLLTLSNGSFANFIILAINSSNQIELAWRTNAGAVNVFTTTASAGRSKIGVGYEAGNIVFFVNGVLINTGVVDVNWSAPLSRLDLGNELDVTTRTQSHNAAALYLVRLSNAELASQTTL